MQRSEEETGRDETRCLEQPSHGEVGTGAVAVLQTIQPQGKHSSFDSIRWPINQFDTLSHVLHNPFLEPVQVAAAKLLCSAPGRGQVLPPECEEGVRAAPGGGGGGAGAADHGAGCQGRRVDRAEIHEAVI